jgi:hypothetical protein
MVSDWAEMPASWRAMIQSQSRAQCTAKQKRRRPSQVCNTRRRVARPLLGSPRSNNGLAEGGEQLTCSAREPRSRGRSGFGGGFASDAMTGFLRDGSECAGAPPPLLSGADGGASVRAASAAAIARALRASRGEAGAGGAGVRADAPPDAAGRLLAGFLGGGTSCTGHTYWLPCAPAVAILFAFRFLSSCSGARTREADFRGL